jgi:hypothetical protein
MSGELEAAGALATAGLAAGAIEGREPGGVHDGACLNCGTAITGPYCSQCGQATHPHRSLLHMIEEFLHGILHFDTKAWRTLPMLAFRPGTLTRDYVYGKRARYISPLALFLFTVFFMFFVFAVGGGPTIGNDESSDIEINASADGDVSEARRELEEARRELARAQAELNDARTNPPADEPEGLSERLAQGAVRIAEQQVERMERQLARQEEFAAERAAETPPAAPEAEQPATEAPAVAEPTATDAPAEEATSPTVIAEGAGEQRWQDELRDAVLRGEVNINSGSAYIDEKIRHSLLNPDLALYKVQNSVYKFSFLLVPISLPFLALLFFWKRGVTLYDHGAAAAVRNPADHHLRGAGVRAADHHRDDCGAVTKRGRYEVRDSATSLRWGWAIACSASRSAGSRLPLISGSIEFRLFTLGWTLPVMVACFFAEDLAYYWFHRIAHERRFFWASHIVHHSSQHYNLTTALRQTWTGTLGLTFIFWLPLC